MEKDSIRVNFFSIVKISIINNCPMKQWFSNFLSPLLFSLSFVKLWKKRLVLLINCNHFRFRQTLINKAASYPWCKVIVCDEAYTSKTCGNCGSLNHKLGGKKVFNCKECHYVADRDISAARNILLRYITRNNIKIGRHEGCPMLLRACSGNNEL